MSLRMLILACIAVFIALVLDHWPLPEMLQWLQPSWMLLVVVLIVLKAPTEAGLWLAIPLGLMLDAERGTLLGLHILTLTTQIFVLQTIHRRLAMFNVLQQMGVVALLVALEQLLSFWALTLVGAAAPAVDIWMPALTSALAWPFVFGLGQVLIVRLGRS